MHENKLNLTSGLSSTLFVYHLSILLIRMLFLIKKHFSTLKREKHIISFVLRRKNVGEFMISFGGSRGEPMKSTNTLRNWNCIRGLRRVMDFSIMQKQAYTCLSCQRKQNTIILLSLLNLLLSPYMTPITVTLLFFPYPSKGVISYN